MNLDKTSAILKKINRLYDIINGIGEASQTEKDLLKAYILDLYEAVALHTDEDELEELEKEEIKAEIKRRKKLDKKLKKQVKKRLEDQEEDDDDDDEDDDDLEVLSDIMGHEDSDDAEQEEESSAQQEHRSEEVVEQEQDDQESPSDSNPELEELFSFSDSSELSDKLANTPLSDLTRAMGINEKIFTVNELFDGNREEMDNLLIALNGLDNYGEAKSVLIRSVASKYDWSDPSRAKKAKNFIRLVRRRYL